MNLQKKIFLFLFIFAFSSKVQADDLYEHKLNLENDILNQITSGLNLLVKPEFYKITVNVVLEKEKKIVKTGQPVSKTAPKEILPGFYAPETSKETVKIITTEKEIEVLKSTTIHLYLREDILAESKKVITDYLNTQWMATNPEVVSVVHHTFPAPLPPVIQEPPVTKEPLVVKESPVVKEKETFSLSDRLAENNWIFWGGVAVILVLLALFFIKNRKKPNSPLKPQESLLPEIKKDDKENEILVNKIKSEFIQNLLDTPLLSRGFLSSLNHKQRKEILPFFQNMAIREWIVNWLGVEDEGSEDTPQSLNAYTLINILSELQEYKKIRQRQLKIPFGFLQDLMDKELINILQHESLEILSTILRYLPQKVAQTILTHLTQKDQALLIKNLQIPLRGDEKKITQTETRLREKYEQLSEKLLLPRRSKNVLVELILDGSPHSTNIAESLIAENPNLKSQYEKYLIKK